MIGGEINSKLNTQTKKFTYNFHILEFEPKHLRFQGLNLTNTANQCLVGRKKNC